VAANRERPTLRSPLRTVHPPDHAGRGRAPRQRRVQGRDARLLEQWNAALEWLDAALGADRDRRRTLAPYGDQLLPADRKQIPEQDLPAGTPPWMLSLKQWATRKGSSAELKRATIEVRVPASERPWE
jgi:hypothetical protein